MLPFEILKTSFVLLNYFCITLCTSYIHEKMAQLLFGAYSSRHGAHSNETLYTYIIFKHTAEL